jgi:hypothetical protein
MAPHLAICVWIEKNRRLATMIVKQKTKSYNLTIEDQEEILSLTMIKIISYFERNPEKLKLIERWEGFWTTSVLFTTQDYIRKKNKQPLQLEEGIDLVRNESTHTNKTDWNSIDDRLTIKNVSQHLKDEDKPYLSEVIEHFLEHQRALDKKGLSAIRSSKNVNKIREEEKKIG